MEKNILISVVVPCYNQGKFLEDCVNSILRQTFQSWECIIIDDGSKDETKEVSIELLKKDLRIKYFSKENGGLSQARNFGIERANGEFILPLDADDYLSENYLEKAYSTLKQSKTIKVTFGVVKNFGTINNWGNKGIIFDYRKQLYSNQIHCSGLYRKADFIEVGGYDENMKIGFEDWEFYIRLLGKGGSALQIGEITLYYRRKEISMLLSLTDGINKLEVSNYIVSKNIKYYSENKIDIMKALEIQNNMKVPASYFSYRFIANLLIKKIFRTIDLKLNKTKR